LRIAVASVPPIVDEIREALGLSATAAGVLTAAPVLCFGAFALLAPMLARRVGAERLLLLALIPITVGVVGRAGGSSAALFAGTVLAGIGVAIANVVVPSIVKSRFQRAVGLVTGSYVSALTGGAALAAGLTVPLERSIGWQGALAIWALPAVAAFVVLGAAVLGDSTPSPILGLEGGVRRLLRDPLAWQVTLYMGLQSFVFYAGLAWIATILRDDGYSPGAAGALLAVFALGGIPTALVVPVLAERMRDQRGLAATVTTVEAVALLGLLLAPDAALAWVALFALGQGGAIGLALALMVLRAPDAKVAAELSGMAQGFGYALAAVGPFAIGAVDDWSGSWDVALSALVAATVPLLIVGVEAGRARTVRAGQLRASG
jgi:MFS transporter, CP family, cyanate transporter